MSDTVTTARPPSGQGPPPALSRAELSRRALVGAYLTKRELAGLFGVCTKSIDVWVNRGRLPRPLAPSGGARGRRLWSAEAVYKALLKMEQEAEGPHAS